MPPNSIQYFSSSPTKNCDGFTAIEEQSETQFCPSPSALWTPTLNYEEVDIGSLSPGPRNLALTGRIVNCYHVAKPSKQHRAAQAYLKIQLADDTGVLTVRLWYVNAVYALRLGQLAALWTVHVSLSSEHNNLAPSTAPLFTSIFPEGERHCYFGVCEESESEQGSRFRRPFGCAAEQDLSGLMTLRSFADGGYEVSETKLLVCVRSIGPRKKYINRNASTSESIRISIFDASADASLTLYNCLCSSTPSLRPSHTILLISNPGWRIDSSSSTCSAKLSLNASSRVDMDPDLAAAHSLRALAARLALQNSTSPAFPTVDEALLLGFESAPVRALYTLADIDAFARSPANAGQTVVGYMSVVITGLDVVAPAKRNMLLCAESACCGVPVYANALQAPCVSCEEPVALRMNPKILGPLIDETGALACAAPVLSDTAWHELLGQSPAQMLDASHDALRYLEHRILLLRMTMGFVISMEHGVGRVGVWCVRK